MEEEEEKIERSSARPASVTEGESARGLGTKANRHGESERMQGMGGKGRLRGRHDEEDDDDGRSWAGLRWCLCM